MKREYFSALNEAEADKYIGKTMEFADRDNIIKQEGWVKKKFKGYTNPKSHYSFKSHKDGFWNFMRTCEETFQREKKVFETWINIYPNEKAGCYQDSREDADTAASPNRVTCLHIRKEYEVEK